MPWAGLEPALPFGNTPLKRVCLPIPPPRRVVRGTITLLKRADRDQVGPACQAGPSSIAPQVPPGRRDLLRPQPPAARQEPRPGPVRGAARTPRHTAATPPEAPRERRPGERIASPTAAPRF